MGRDVFAGRHVLIVGFGQASGADVCELAAKDAASVTVLSDKPIFLTPRLRDGRPAEDDINVLSMLHPQLWGLLVHLPSLEKHPPQAPEDFIPGVHTPTRVWALHQLIAMGRVAVRRAHVISCLDGRALLSDGGVLPADVIVWCTGYHSRALDVFEPQLRAEVLKDAPLYEGMWVPTMPGLVLIGHDENVWYYLEMQARWAARVWSGSAPPLPDTEVMRAWIIEARIEMAALPLQNGRKPPLLKVPGEALPKLCRMAVRAGVWPPPPQVALQLFSTFEPRFAHGP